MTPLRFKNIVFSLFLMLATVTLPCAQAANPGDVKTLIAAKKAIRENPDSVKAHRAYQSAMNRDGWKAQMIEEYAQRLKENQSPQNLYLLARLKDEKEQEPLFRQLIEKYPDFSWGYFGMAGVLQDQGQSQEANRLYEKTIVLDPKNTDAYYNLAYFYDRQKQYEEADRTILRGLQEVPGDAELLACHGALLRMLGKFQEALSAFEKSLESDPENAFALRELSVLHTDAKRHDDAAQVRRKYLDLWPDKAMEWARLAQNLLELYDRSPSWELLEQSEDAWQKAVEIAPKNVDAYATLTDYYTDRKWWVHGLWFNKRGYETADEASESHKGFAHNREWIPANQMGISDFRIEAVMPAELATQAQPEAAALHNQALTLMRQKDYRGAREALKQAASLDPADPAIRYHTRLMRLFDEAVVEGTVSELKDLAQAVKAGAGINLDTFEVFVEPFQRYLKRDPTSWKIFEAYGDIFAASPNPAYLKNAIPYYQKAIELGGDPETLKSKINSL